MINAGVYTNVFDQSTNLFRIIMRKKQLEGWIKLTKKKKNVLVECSVSTQKHMLQMFVTILTAGWYKPDSPVQL